ncbi:hypothetical protein [Mycobacterium sp.]|jgi:hypothetical protein|uniref:hypothetical protein n=1 Tax=Mycobacterium sp. TaxID=1785 RepID=UPI0033409C63|nr:hypothetical protein [Mycobacterium sp.]
MSRSSFATLDALIAKATLDCYNDSECVTGFYTMLDDSLVVPFHTVVLGVDVTVAGIDLTDDEQIMAVCTRSRSTQRIPILDLPLPIPQPDGAEWIAAYRRWVKGA